MLSKSKRGEIVSIGVASFFESVFSPIPVDPVLVMLVLKYPDYKHHLWIVVSGASILGAIVGYHIGYYFFPLLGQPIIDFYKLQSSFDLFSGYVHKYGFWAMMLKPFLPVPFKLAVIVYGAVKFNFWIFLLVTTISRPIRFCLVTYLVVRYGMRYREWVAKYVHWLKAFYVVMIIGFMVAVAMCV